MRPGQGPGRDEPAPARPGEAPAGGQPGAAGPRHGSTTSQPAVFRPTRFRIFRFVWAIFHSFSFKHSICLSHAERIAMKLSFGEWLWWSWICGIGNHLVHLSVERLGSEVILLPRWVPMRIYYLYWDVIGDVGVVMSRMARQRLGYWPTFFRGF